MYLSIITSNPFVTWRESGILDFDSVPNPLELSCKLTPLASAIVTNVIIIQRTEKYNSTYNHKGKSILA
ncbi:MAG: hypothetical protein WA631_16990 [Nitrososphaeraceae archaeon]